MAGEILPPQNTRSLALSAAGGGFGGALLAILVAKLLAGPDCCCGHHGGGAMKGAHAESPVAVAELQRAPD